MPFVVIRKSVGNILIFELPGIFRARLPACRRLTILRIKRLFLCAVCVWVRVYVFCVNLAWFFYKYWNTETYRGLPYCAIPIIHMYHLAINARRHDTSFELERKVLRNVDVRAIDRGSFPIPAFEKYNFILGKILWKQTLVCRKTFPRYLLNFRVSPKTYILWKSKEGK